MHKERTKADDNPCSLEMQPKFSIRVKPKNALTQCADNQVAIPVFTGGFDG